MSDFTSVTFKLEQFYYNWVVDNEVRKLATGLDKNSENGIELDNGIHSW